MIRTLGSRIPAVGGGAWAAHAGFRGQIGKDSALPHAMTSNAKLKAGDVLVTGAGADVWGYGSELERTMIMGEPSPEQERYFDLMLQAQTLALDTIKPASNARMWTARFMHSSTSTVSRLLATSHRSRQVDADSRGAISRHRRHRMIEVGMVFTVEPGIYVPGFAASGIPTPWRSPRPAST